MGGRWASRSKWEKSGTVGFIFMLNEDLTFKSSYLSETMKPSGMALRQQVQGHHWFTLQIYWTYYKKYCAGHFEKRFAEMQWISFLMDVFLKNISSLYQSTPLVNVIPLVSKSGAFPPKAGEFSSGKTPRFWVLFMADNWQLCFLPCWYLLGIS